MDLGQILIRRKKHRVNSPSGKTTVYCDIFDSYRSKSMCWDVFGSFEVFATAQASMCICFACVLRSAHLCVWSQCRQHDVMLHLLSTGERSYKQSCGYTTTATFYYKILHCTFLIRIQYSYKKEFMSS